MIVYCVAVFVALVLEIFNATRSAGGEPVSYSKASGKGTCSAQTPSRVGEF